MSLHADAAGDGELASTTASVARSEAGADGPERRQTTVLFCDLVDSTALSAKLDPEDLREVLHAFRRVARTVVARHEGFIASYLGDGVLVLFAYPRAHEDDPQRAVRAGLELVRAVADIVTPQRATLRARVGIATGITVIGPLVASGSSFDEIVVGQTTNLAARLQSLAGPNAVVISDATKRLVADDFEYQTLGPHALKGFDQPVLCWLVVRERVEQDVNTRRLRERQLPLIGRRHELQILSASWQRAVGESGSLVVIQGEPGVGKSRLVTALRQQIERDSPAFLRYLCAPRFQNAALFPVIREVERAAAIAPDDAAPLKLDKLEDFLRSGDLVQDVPSAVATLASLLSIPLEGRYPAIVDSAEKLRVRTFQTLKEILYATARRGPVLLVIEDIHWIDPTTNDLLSEILEEVGGRRLLVVVTVRSGFGGACPPCAGTVTLNLERMSLEESKLMIAQLANERPLSSELLDRIARKSEGVALFTEELTKVALEYGSFAEGVGGRELDDSSAEPIPSTLQDSLAARLDRLSPVKELVRVASAIGREFAYDLLKEVMGVPEAELLASLRLLISADIVRIQDEAQHRYSFKHALLQEAAYAMMLRGTRQSLHRRIAVVLTNRSPARDALDAEVVAHHYIEAGEALLAVPYLEAAAQRASARAAHTEARRLLMRALEIVVQSAAGPRRDELELQLSVSFGLATSAAQGYAAPDVEAAYQRSLDLSRRLGKTKELFPALRGLCTFYIVRGALETARDLGEECLRLAESSRSPADLIESCTALGYIFVYQGHLARGQEHLRRAIAVYRDNDGERLRYPSLQDPAVASLALLGIASWMRGDTREADRLQGESLQLSDRLGQPFNQAYAHSFAALLCNFRRRYREAAQHAAIAREVADKHGFPVWFGAATIHGAVAQGCSEDAAGAVPVLVHMLALWQAGGAELSRPAFLWGLARCQAAAGSVEAALQSLEEALSTGLRTGEGFLRPEIFRLQGELLRSAEGAQGGRWQDALWSAADTAKAQGASLLELRALRALCAHGGERLDEAAARFAELKRELSDADNDDDDRVSPPRLS